MPNYELLVTIPSITSLSEYKIPVSITAEYTFGKLVNGNGLFIVHVDGIQRYGRSVSVVNGLTSFDLSVPDFGEGTFEYFFSMNDSVIESTETADGVFQIVDFSYRLKIFGSDLISPGSPYNFTVSMNKFDGTPAPQGTVVTVTVEPENNEIVLNLNKDGTAPAVIDIPTDATYIQLLAKANQTQDGFLRANAPNNGVQSFIDLYVGFAR